MQENYSVLQVDDDELECWSKQSIYRILPSVAELNRRAYKPQIVSIGPYHYGSPHLSPMEEHKHRALNHFLRRANRTLESLVRALTPFVQDLKDAYYLLDSRWTKDDDEFLKMMIVDGCFVLELLRTTQAEDRPVTSVSQDYARNDPVFSKHGELYIVPYLRRDMLMLENQIPMKVLEELLSIQYNNLPEKDTHLTRLILDFFSQILEFFSQRIPAILERRHLHILDVYRKSLLLEEPLSKRRPMVGRAKIIRSVTDISEAGISIQQSRTRSLKDISFSGGVLRLPLIVVDDSLESLYLNMMAFERYHVGAGNEVTSYIFFMDSIIDNARDVSLLHSCNVIQNALGSDKAVANLFNSLSKDITLDPDNTLYQVHAQVSQYCRKPWPRLRVSLLRIYLTKTWITLSVIAAIVAFALTTIQTVFTVLSYFDQHSSS